MARLVTLGSGSSGNCYLIETQTGTLVLELGVRWSDVLKAVSYDISRICGALVSHVHGDHASHVNDALTYRIPVYSCREVADRYNGVVVLEAGKRYDIGGGFLVQPISVPHNAECYSYIIEHPECGKILFCTDLSEFPYRVRDVTNFLIEADYSEEVVFGRLSRSDSFRSHPENHMSIDACVDVLKRNVNPETRTVTLIHLSSENSDEAEFRRKVRESVGIDAAIALKGVEVELDKEEF